MIEKIFKYIPFYALLIVLLNSCNSYKTPHENNINSNESYKDTLCNQISKRTAEILNNKYELQFVAMGGGGSKNEKIKLLSLHFYYNKPILITEARELLINASEIFLKEINSNNKISSYVSNFPFTEKNIEIVIYSHNDEYKNYSPPNLANFANVCGRLDYYVKEDGKLKLFHKESYEEALEKIKEETKK